MLPLLPRSVYLNAVARVVLLMCRSDYVSLSQNTAALPFSLRVKVSALHRTTRISVTSPTSSTPALPFAQVTCSGEPSLTSLSKLSTPFPPQSVIPVVLLNFFLLNTNVNVIFYFSCFFVYLSLQGCQLHQTNELFFYYFLFIITSFTHRSLPLTQ